MTLTMILTIPTLLLNIKNKTNKILMKIKIKIKFLYK